MLVERENAIVQFGQVVDKLINGSGGIALVNGEAGIGKTLLLEQTRRGFEKWVTCFIGVAARYCQVYG